MDNFFIYNHYSLEPCEVSCVIKKQSREAIEAFYSSWDTIGTVTTLEPNIGGPWHHDVGTGGTLHTPLTRDIGSGPGCHQPVVSDNVASQCFVKSRIKFCFVNPGLACQKHNYIHETLEERKIHYNVQVVPIPAYKIFEMFYTLWGNISKEKHDIMVIIFLFFQFLWL